MSQSSNDTSRLGSLWSCLMAALHACVHAVNKVRVSHDLLQGLLSFNGVTLEGATQQCAAWRHRLVYWPVTSGHVVWRRKKSAQKSCTKNILHKKILQKKKTDAIYEGIKLRLVSWEKNQSGWIFFCQRLPHMVQCIEVYTMLRSRGFSLICYKLKGLVHCYILQQFTYTNILKNIFRIYL